MRFGRKKATPKLPTPDNETGPPQPEKPFAVWILEILSLLGSVLCLLAILILLGAFNNKPLPNWNFITLNGIISVLSDLAHAALIYPVTEAIGQLKWVWYWDKNRPRRISDFESYNNASRGPFGSLVFLFKPQLWHLSTIGSILVIAGLAMQTFLQLMPNYEARPTKTDGVASLHSCNNYTQYIMDPDGLAGITAGQAAALSNGIYGTASDASTSQQFSSGLDTQCATGNCTWTSHSSLGICSFCHDVGDQLKRISEEEWSLPGVNISRQFQFTFSSMDPSINWLLMKDYIIIETMFVWWDPADEKNITVPPHAFDCLLHYCANSYSTRIINGKLFENTTSSFPHPNTTSPDDLRNGVSFGVLPSAPAVAKNYTLIHSNNATANSSSSPPTVFLINAASTYAIFTWLHVQFSAASSIEWNSQGYGDIGKQIYASVHAHNSPGPIFQSLASSLTTHMRNIGTQPVLGASFTTKTFVSVRWGWAALPFALLLGALVFLIATAGVSKRGRVPVWKNCALPELLYGIPWDDGAEIRAMGPGLKGLEAGARGWEMGVDDEGRLRASRANLVEKERGNGNGKWWRRGGTRSLSVGSLPG